MEIHEPIDQKKQLNIIAIADDSACGRNALCFGEKLTEVFGATLTVVTRFGFSYEEKKQKSINPPISQVGHLQPDGYFFPETLYRYADEENTIMFVIGVDDEDKDALFNKRRALRFIKPSRLPVLTVGRKGPEDNAFQRVILPIDIERQAKEKALWAGYFSRFYKATIHVLHCNYPDEGLHRQVADNIAFVEKLYQNLEVQYQLDEVTPQPNIDHYALEYAPRVGATLTVTMMTRYRTLGDILVGPAERKLVGNATQFPVLCINQRDDLYVLCT
jgi:hypothetical protein